MLTHELTHSLTRSLTSPLCGKLQVLLAQRRQIERQQQQQVEPGSAYYDDGDDDGDEDYNLQVSATGPEDLATILSSHGVRIQVMWWLFNCTHRSTLLTDSLCHVH